MPAVVARWGNSLAVRIPTVMAEKANFYEGVKVDVSVSRSGRVVLESIPYKIDFGKLYDQITPENRYEEVNMGAEVGNETVVW
jgi:antitoxin MazE